jgi:hypothetical protein
LNKWAHVGELVVGECKLIGEELDTIEKMNICYKWACVILLGSIDLQNNCDGIKVFNTIYIVTKVNTSKIVN